VLFLKEKNTLKNRREHMTMKFLYVVAAAVALLVSHAHGFAFDLAGKKSRCFSEEIPTGVEVKIQYVALPGYAQYVDVKLTDPQNKVIWSEHAQDRATFADTILVGGDYALCFYSRMVPGASFEEGMKRTINVEFLTGTETQDYGSLATREHLKPLELNLRVMEDVVRSLHNDYTYFKEREEEMRNTNEHMNSKVMYMTLGVMLAIVAFSLWQVRHLKSYFRRKRMID
jgi:p24 family protein delta-1